MPTTTHQSKLNRVRGLRTGAIAAVAGAALAFVACGGANDSTSSDDSVSNGRAGAIESFAQSAEAPAADSGLAFPGSAPPFVDASAGGGESPNTASQVDFLGRSIIRTGSMDLRVSSVAESFEQVSSIASGAGGFIGDSRFFGQGDEQTASLTIRVPSDRFESVLDQLRALAIEVDSISTSAQDVTGEVTDLESSLRNLRAVEAQYIELLGRANAIGDVLQVQDRLNQTRGQIEQIQGRIQLLDRLSDLATLSVSLRPESAPPVVASGDAPLDAARAAWDASLASLSNIATVALVVVVYSWWLLPLLAVAAFIVRRLLRAASSSQTRRTSIDTPQGTA